jgi:hypothetical protein
MPGLRGVRPGAGWYGGGDTGTESRGAVRKGSSLACASAVSARRAGVSLASLGAPVLSRLFALSTGKLAHLGGALPFIRWHHACG